MFSCAAPHPAAFCLPAAAGSGGHAPLGQATPACHTSYIATASSREYRRQGRDSIAKALHETVVDCDVNHQAAGEEPLEAPWIALQSDRQGKESKAEGRGAIVRTNAVIHHLRHGSLRSVQSLLRRALKPLPVLMTLESKGIFARAPAGGKHSWPGSHGRLKPAESGDGCQFGVSGSAGT